METLTQEKIENITMKASFFDSKEHYLQFKAAWKQYIADGKHLRETYTDSQGGICKMDSALTCSHHLIYNALRNCDLKKSFSPITNQNKLKSQYSRDPYRAFEYARNSIKWALKSSASNSADWLLTPFGDTVTKEMLEDVYAINLEDLDLK